jgi:transglutaminase-like putative cysteine protease
VTQRRHITLISAGATILASLPLATVFEKWTWLVLVLIVTVAMTGAAIALRSVRAPAWAPTAGMIGAYLITLTWLFPSHDELVGVIPTPATVLHWNDLLVQAGVAIRDNGVPVYDDKGLLFLAALGIGAVLLAIDLCAVVAHRPAIAGVPMAAIYLVAVGTHSDSVSFLPFVSTAAAFLWLLATDNVDRVRRFGRRFTGDGRDVDVWEPSPLAAAGRRLAVVGVAVAVILPLAVPGMTTGLLDRFGSGVGNGAGTGGGPGRAGNVNLFSYLSGSLVRDRTYDMVRVTTNDPTPFYLRFGVAEELTTNGFVNRNWGPGQGLNNVATPLAPAGNGVVNRPYRANVEILQFNEQMLPVFQHLTRIEKVDNSWLWDKRAAVVYSNRSSAKGRKYSFDYVRQEFSVEALRGAQQLSGDDPIQQQYTLLPRVPAVQAKAEELIRGKTTPYDKVRAIYDFFTTPANGFKYNLSTRAGNSGSVMVDFLNNREGYCEQYAAAMAWLVRAAKIPSRVAFGFTRGSNRIGNTYTLNNFNLHAWTEVYFEKFGWVPFDATPAAAISGSVSTNWAPDPTVPSGQRIGGEAPDDVTGGDPSANPSGAANPDKFGPNDPGAASRAGGVGALPRWPLYTGGGLALALLLLLLPAVRRASLRRRRWPGRGGHAGAAGLAATAAGKAGRGGRGRKAGPGEIDLTGAGPDAGGAGAGAGGAGAGSGGSGADSPEVVAAAEGFRRQEAHAAWDELVDTMIDYRLPVDPAETPRVTAERLVSQRAFSGQAAEGAQLLGQAEERARYARAPLPGPDLGLALRSVRTALRRGVSRRTRLIATFLPPSVITRWRAALVSTYTAAVNASARRRDAVARTMSPRRLITTRGGR